MLLQFLVSTKRMQVLYTGTVGTMLWQIYHRVTKLEMPGCFQVRILYNNSPGEFYMFKNTYAFNSLISVLKTWRDFCSHGSSMFKCSTSGGRPWCHLHDASFTRKPYSTVMGPWKLSAIFQRKIQGPSVLLHAQISILRLLSDMWTHRSKTNAVHVRKKC